MKSIQDRVLYAWPKLEVETLKDLLEALRKQLLKAHQAELMKTPLEEIRKWVRVNAKDNEEILGGIKDFRRDGASARLIRDDDAWIHFTIRARQEARATLPGRASISTRPITPTLRARSAATSTRGTTISCSRRR